MYHRSKTKEAERIMTKEKELNCSRSKEGTKMKVKRRGVKKSGKVKGRKRKIHRFIDVVFFRSTNTSPCYYDLCGSLLLLSCVVGAA